MSRNRLLRVMKRYSPTGRMNHGRPLKRLLDKWDRNRSTSGPTPWQIHDDDDDDRWKEVGKLNFRLVKKEYITFLCGQQTYVNFHSETKGTGESTLENEVLGEVSLWEQKEPLNSLRDKGVRSVENVPECFSRYSLVSISNKRKIKIKNKKNS
jgi:hypothetical protein